MSEQNKTLARRFYDEVIGAGNIDLIDELVHDSFVEHETFPGLPPGKEGVKEFFTMFRSAFPDIRFDVKDIIAEGDTIAARITINGTHQGEFAGIPATGKEISVNTIDMMRISDGKAVEHWGVTDQLSMMQQLGIIPEG